MAPEWSCSGSAKAVWDLVLRLDYGSSPLDGRLQLKSSFLGKTKLGGSATAGSELSPSFFSAMDGSTKQVYHRSVVKRVPVGTCQVSCTIGIIEVLPSESSFCKTEE